MKTIFALIVAFCITTPSFAVLITVDTVEYDIAWETGTFEAVNATRDLEGQAWWGTKGLAEKFATALGYQVTPVVNQFYAYGPNFAYSISNVILVNRTYVCAAVDGYCGGVNRPEFNYIGESPNVYYLNDFTWAYASPRLNVPEPGSIALLLLGLAGLGISRKARR
ncbi:MAG: hypothetical protein ACI92E_000204 [Oceanicoccus sp.]|jgi:hypothetical protein